MSFLNQVETGAVPVRPLKIVVHGAPGVGKSTLAADAPKPIFLDAERGTLALAVNRLHVESWSDLLGMINDLTTKPHEYQSVVFDTLDAIERLLSKYVCQSNNNADSIEKVGGGYGKGWTAVAEQWAKLFAALDRLQRERGMHVIALAHTDATKFSDPDGADYNRWSLRLHKKGSAAWIGWCEDMLFATRQVSSTKNDKGKGKGGRRVLYTEWTPGREAKNRHGLPECIDLAWRALDAALMDNVAREEKKAALIAEQASAEFKRQQPALGAPAPEPTPPPAQASAGASTTTPTGATTSGESELAATFPDGSDQREPETAHGEHDHHAERVAEVKRLAVLMDGLGMREVALQSVTFAESHADSIATLDNVITRQRALIQAEDAKREAEAAKAESEQETAHAHAGTGPSTAETGFVAPF